MSLQNFPPKPEILFEDAHILVCIKPSGVPTQSSRIGTPDLVSMLKNHIHKQETGRDAGAKEPYLAVIHRLDQPVEGILVFAKTPFAAKELNRQLQTDGFGKYYQALICGKPEAPEATLTDYLVKDARTNISKVCSRQAPNAKKAVLHYQTEQTKADLPCDTTLVSIRLETGRHHQIRVQMAHAGYPLYGDTKYNTRYRQSTGWHQIALCASRLEFLHPKTKKKLAYACTPAFLR